MGCKKCKQHQCKEGAPEWMCTFADLMSLLLTFFVLLLSFSNMEIVKFRTMAGSIRNAFGLRSPMDISPNPPGGDILPKPAPAYNTTMTESKKQVTMVRLRDALEKTEMTDAGNVKIKDRGVALSMDGDQVFDSGKTDLKPVIYPLLDRLADIAQKQPGTIEVEGHTDDVPIRTDRFPSNWELSAARAGSAVRYLATKSVPAQRMKAIGYADTVPVVPNDSVENRAKNRRVEFLFVNPDDETGTPEATGSEGGPP